MKQTIKNSNPTVFPYSRKFINWDKKPLGLISDTRLAEILGVNRSTVSKARRRRGIPVYDPSKRAGFFEVAKARARRHPLPVSPVLLTERNYLSEYRSLRNDVDESTAPIASKVEPLAWSGCWPWWNLSLTTMRSQK